MASNIDFDSNVDKACQLLREAQLSGAGLLIFTGAGMSVQSGVPVFRGADGSMSADFLKFLGDYNAARKKHGLEEADDWFSFSVPEMFRPETADAAWQYWRWRALRARVQPAEDYQLLNKIIGMFGSERIFTVTSNCDMLHATAGLPEENIYEIHGSLGYLQCSKPCRQTLYPADATFLQRLQDEPMWVPMCPHCSRCLRPNVMIFGDYALVDSRLNEQERQYHNFKRRFVDSKSTPPAVVLEIGAGRVVSSIRRFGESVGLQNAGSAGLIRVNPSSEECEQLEMMPHLAPDQALASKYFPLDKKSSDALRALCKGLDL